jgi:preprotein translocase SecE subunit
MPSCYQALAAGKNRRYDYPVRKIFSFLKEARVELGKVVWPTRRRATRLTAIVVLVTVMFGVFIGVVDFGLSKGVQYVIDATQNKKKSLPAGTQPIQIPGGAPGGQPAPAPPNQPGP